MIKHTVRKTQENTHTL